MGLDGKSQSARVLLLRQLWVFLLTEEKNGGGLGAVANSQPSMLCDLRMDYVASLPLF